jgi:hypothetical protein
MGGGCSKAPALAEVAASPEVDHGADSPEPEFYAESPEEAEAIQARMAAYAESKEKRRLAKERSRLQKIAAASDERAIALLRKQLSEILCAKQLTTEFQIGRYGNENYSKNKFRLPNRMFDFDRIEVKSIDLSRGNDLKRPEPIVARCTFDWTNSVQKVMGTAHESYEAMWLGDVWKLRTVA